MTTVDHAHLDQLEAQSRRDHQTARQALAATDRQTSAAAPPPADMTDVCLAGVLAHVAAFVLRGLMRPYQRQNPDERTPA